MSDYKNAAILGVSGYTGAEAVRLLLGHPQIKIKALTAHSRAGQPLSNLYPQFAESGLPDVTKWDAVDWNTIDVAFACLPHGASQDIIGKIADKVETVIDLSADFRLSDPELYAQTYGRSHDNGDLLQSAVYGLTEYSRQDLKGAKLVACPGCYPTCSLLTLLPAIEAKAVSLDDIIIDAKSGVTGAGRKVKDGLLYSQLTDGAHAYGVGNHRHVPEIEQMLTKVTGKNVRVSFTPHLLPMNRGMITTIYVKLNEGMTANKLRDLYVAKYRNEPFVSVLSEGEVPHTRHVKATNMCRVGVFSDSRADRAILVGVIDNLTKGSSGQAIQNYNSTQGWNETLGLQATATFP